MYSKKEVEGFDGKNFQSVDVTNSHCGKICQFVQFW